MNGNVSDVSQRVSAVNNVYNTAMSCQTSNPKSAPGNKIQADLAALRDLMVQNGFSPEEIALVTNITNEDVMMAVETLLDRFSKKVRDKDGNLTVKPVSNPTICFVAGQPGCGKSNGIKIMAESLGDSGKPFESEMDAYRNMHPHIKALKEMIDRRFPGDINKQGSLFVSMTSVWADMVELAVSSYLLSQGFNVIKQTTGKNANSIIEH